MRDVLIPMKDSNEISLSEFSILCEKNNLTFTNPDLLKRLFIGYRHLQEMLGKLPQDIQPSDEPATVQIDDSCIVSK